MSISEAQRNRIKYAIYKDGKIINYRHPLKVVVNNILRIAQFWTKEKYIFATLFKFSDENDMIMGTRLMKIKHKYYLPVRYANIR
jgi:hypothetical protein